MTFKNYNHIVDFCSLTLSNGKIVTHQAPKGTKSEETTIILEETTRPVRSIKGRNKEYNHIFQLQFLDKDKRQISNQFNIGKYGVEESELVTYNLSDQEQIIGIYGKIGNDYFESFGFIAKTPMP